MSNVVSVVNMAPFPLHVEMPGCIPASYDIAEPVPGRMVVVPIVDARSIFYIDADRGSLPLHRPADYVAQDIVRHYRTGQIFTLPEDAEGIGGYPAVAYFDGKHDSESIEAMFPEELRKLKQEQDKWYVNLIKVGDDIWQLNRQHRAISDLQRKVAKIMGLKREWAEKPDPSAMVECMFCTSLISKRAVVCPICHNTVSPDAMAMLQGKIKAAIGGETLTLPTAKG